MNRRLACLVHIGTVFSCLTASHAAVAFVDGRVAVCGDGQSWPTAYKYLQDALAAARIPGSGITEIWVAVGTYRPDRECANPAGTGARTATFQLVDGVALRGGFAGTEDPLLFDLATRNFETNKTILSGDLAGNDGSYFVNYTENSYHVAKASGVLSSTILDGFTISAGYANGTSPDNDGAGLHSINGSSPTLTNCSFTANRASNLGGGMYDSGSSTLINCVFIGNYGIQYGGGIANVGGSPTMTNCTVALNTGGGVYMQSDTMSLSNCIVWGNRTPQITGSATVTYSCVEGGWPGTGNIDADPGMMFLAGGNMRLRFGSPCIDAGNNAALPVEIVTDMASQLRFVDDPVTADTGNPGNPPKAVVDMGACEYQPVSQKRLYVKANGLAGGDGLSWSMAFVQLQDALILAQNDPAVTEIWVAGGTYRPDRDAANPGGTGDRTATFKLANGVAVYGGFPGQSGEEGNFSLRNPTVYETILSGDLAGNDGENFTNNGENSYHVVIADSLGPSAVFDGLTVTRGNAGATDLSSNGSGGGMLVLYGRPTLTGCVFSENYACDRAGGMLNTGSPALTNCTFSGNSAYWLDAGGMYNQGNPRLTNCKFVGNSVRRKSGKGGGLRNSGNPILVNCVFSGNSTAYSGEAIFNSGNPTFVNCTIAGNVHIQVDGNYAGDAISSGGTLSLTNCIVWGNSGSQIVLNYGSATITNSCVQGGWTGAGNIDLDPKFLSLPSGDLRFRHGSPCIDAGDSTGVPAGITTDLAGLPRMVDDPDTSDTGNPGDPPIAVVDMGAYEYEPTVATRLYVKADATSGGNGQSWAAAYPFLQDALLRAQTDPGVTEVWVAAGTYKPDRDANHTNGTGDRNATFQLLGGVPVYGGFPGHPGQEGSFSVRNPTNYVTILSGDLAGNDDQDFTNISDNAYQVVRANGIGREQALDGCTVEGGSNPGSGAGLVASSGDPMLSNCIFRMNSSGRYGGGLYIAGNSPQVVNCLFVGNRASLGGGIYCSSGALVVVNCVFTGNQGYALYGSSYGGSVGITVANCIMWGNDYTQIANIGSGSVTYSCIQGGYSGTGNTSADPMFVNAAGGDLRLQPGSPCIDAGDNGAVAAGVVTDLDGLSRFVDDPATPDTGNGTPPLVDMGAYEFQFIPGDFDTDGDVDLTDFAHLQVCLKGNQSAQTDPNCQDAKLNADNYVDQIDVGIFLGCLSGSGIPADPNCAD